MLTVHRTAPYLVRSRTLSDQRASGIAEEADKGGVKITAHATASVFS